MARRNTREGSNDKHGSSSGTTTAAVQRDIEKQWRDEQATKGRDCLSSKSMVLLGSMETLI